MIPGLLSSLVATLITGRIMTGLSSRKILIRAFLITAVASLILGADALAVFEHIGGSGVWLGIGFAVLGVGVGMIDPVSNDFILSAAPPDRAGAAASLSETGYELGGAFWYGGVGFGAASRLRVPAQPHHSRPRSGAGVPDQGA